MSKFSKNLVAPCGINCGVCLHYLRAKNICPGCFSGRKVNNRPIKCGRRLCKKREGEFCFECSQFPCDSIKRLDNRYQTKYDMSPIENLEFIKEHGTGEFIKQQEEKYTKDGKVLCIHDKKWYPISRSKNI